MTTETRATPGDEEMLALIKRLRHAETVMERLCEASGIEDPALSMIALTENYEAMETKNAAMLVALEALVRWCDDDNGYYGDEITAARAAIALAKGTR